MDKTISISIGGFSFIVDDGAFFKLKTYLDEIKRSLNGMDGIEEVISDVEVRIAELFKEKLGSREVVNEQDVDAVIAVMGRPEQFVDEDGFDNEESSKSKSTKSTYTSTYSSEKTKKKLYRDIDDKVLGGVLSGLAHYLGIETWITRVIWILMFFADIPITGTSFTIVSYIILWIILPKAETATQKYEMYGQVGDFETIKTNATKTVHEMKDKAGDVSGILGKLLRVMAKIFLVLIGISLIFMGIGLIIGAIVSLFALSNQVPFKFFDYIIDYTWQEWTAKITLLVLMLVPAILFILVGGRLISERVKINKSFVLGSIAIWFVAIISAAILGVSIGKNYSQEISFSDKKSFTVSQDTIHVNFEELKRLNQPQQKWKIDDLEGIIEFDGKLYSLIENDVEVKKSPNNQLMVEVIYSAKGANADDARKNAETITYNYSMNANGELKLDEFISLTKNAKYRNQTVDIVLYIPEGKTIHFNNADDVTYQSSDSYHEDYFEGNNKFFKFVGDKLECLNCLDAAESDEYYFDESEFDSAKVKISKDGIRIQDGDKKVIIRKNKINISDDTDTVKLDISGN